MENNLAIPRAIKHKAPETTSPRYMFGETFHKSRKGSEQECLYQYHLCQYKIEVYVSVHQYEKCIAVIYRMLCSY